MKRLALLVPAISMAVVALPGVASAQAATPASAQASAQAAAPLACSSSVKAKENINIRASIGGTSLGLFYKGDTACLNSRSTGPSYTACGITGTTYYNITYGSKRGWIVSGCVTKV
ncbi:hypothetical protein J4573_01045 [Actinomadura barringtoniae]|uniref:SH3 domain-containing protein n=1 Tax=Actinomadura barringtoniae TaxID=1427535 RepID=A0A939P6D3_9ACTN|nr:hypothetical protein [Actinomadura barringtoniae]MBO2445667.1 hypothetical protein [Actinomadura barringtoniae]